MKRTIRIEIEPNIASQLSEKQEKIDNGEKTHQWWRLSDNQRDEIKSKLLQSQGNLCCYCECKINDANLHIEHFVERHDNPQRVYDYQNMLLSCEGDRNNVLPDINTVTTETYENARQDRIINTSCGHKKSKPYHNEEEIDYNLLLNPSNDRTEKLLSYFDGLIEPSDECSQEEKNQSIYTIKRLSLDSDKLNTRRDIRITEVQNQLKTMDKTEQKTYIMSLLDLTKVQHTPYYSTIKDNFEYLLNQ